MELIFMGLDSLVVSALYYFYKKKSQTLFNVQNARELDLTNGLLDANGKETSVVEYAMVSGLVKPDETDLISHFGQNHHGVLRTLKIVEHLSRYEKETWKDYTRTVTNSVNHVPFSLVSNFKKPSPFQIKIENPLNARYLFENLELTFKKFDMNHDSFAEKLVNHMVSNEVVRGLETTEEMLRINTNLIGFGRLERISALNELSGNGWLASKATQFYRLTEPECKELAFIVTPLTRSALIERLRSSTKVLKVFLIIFGSIGATLGAYILLKYFIFVSRYFIDDNQDRQQHEHRD